MKDMTLRMKYPSLNQFIEITLIVDDESRNNG